MVFFPAVALPFAVLSTKSLYVIGPLGLLAVFFFTLSFMALGYNYVPSEELLDKEEEEEAAMESVEDNACLELQDEELDDKKETLQSQRSERRQKIIREKLDEWCAAKGYRDTSLNMITLSRSLNISRYELSRYLSSCLNTTFRPWLAEVRFEAAKKMMLDNPDFGNDIISAECGFSSRTHLYRMFKEKEGCSPTAWREKTVKKYVLGVAFPTNATPMWGNATPCFKEKHYLCTMKSIIDSFAKEEQAILIVALFLLIYVGIMINVMVRKYRTYLDDYPMYHFSLGDFIRRGRFYICLILGVVFITFVCLVVSLMAISIQ